MSKCLRNVVFKTKSLPDLTAGLLHDRCGGQLCADGIINVIIMSKYLSLYLNLSLLDPHHTKYNKKRCHIIYGYNLYF